MYAPLSSTPVCLQNSQEVDQTNKDIKFSTPQGKPPVDQENVVHASTTSALHMKGEIKDRMPLVVSEVRSLKIQHLNNGFKKKTCTDKSCMACRAKPPDFTTKWLKI